MTKTEARRRVALAALLAGTIAAAHEARAITQIASNGPDPYGFAGEAASAQPSAGPVELTERQMDQVTAGAGQVSMQDFHFVMRSNSSSPGLLDKPDPVPTTK